MLILKITATVAVGLILWLLHSIVRAAKAQDELERLRRAHDL
jgi:uncharacterized integral membrane protein